MSGVRGGDVGLVRDNEDDSVKLENPPTDKPTKCAKCKKVIRLAEDGYSMKGGKYYCHRCSGRDLSRLLG